MGKGRVNHAWSGGHPESYHKMVEEERGCGCIFISYWVIHNTKQNVVGILLTVVFRSQFNSAVFVV